MIEKLTAKIENNETRLADIERKIENLLKEKETLSEKIWNQKHQLEALKKKEAKHSQSSNSAE